MNYLRTALSTAAQGEPVERSEVKDHLRIAQSSDAENTLLSFYIKTAREFAEQFTGRKFLTQTWKYYLDEFPGNEIEMPFAPLIASSLAFTYKSCSGSSNSVSASTYSVDTDSTPGRIKLLYGETWPGSTLSTINPICITFKCGYGLKATDVPIGLRTWIMSCVGFMYENRERDVSEFPIGTLRHYKVGWL